MNNLKISSEKAPDVFLFIQENFLEIKKILNNKKGREPTLKKHLTINEAIQFLANQGCIISKSKIYKLTSSNQIPFFKFNNKLVFSELDLQNWIDISMTHVYHNKNSSIENVVKSASKILKNQRNDK